LHGMQGVRGSNPLSSTKRIKTAFMAVFIRFMSPRDLMNYVAYLLQLWLPCKGINAWG
jgi:hypothetical protein